MLTVQMTGIAEVIQKLQRLVPAPLTPAAEALRTEGNQIIRVANTLVPVDTGLLRSTGAVEAPVQVGPSVSVTLRYGAYGLAPYAAVVHEDTTMNHPHGGQHHFLSEPLYAATAGMTTRLAAAIGPALSV